MTEGTTRSTTTDRRPLYWQSFIMCGREAVLSYLNLERHCPLDHGRHDLQPKASLGDLDVVPLDILTAILLLIDLRTIYAIRRVNQYAMALVDSVLEYRHLVAYAPNVLRGVLACGTDGDLTIKALHDALKERHCQLIREPYYSNQRCGNAGQYICILTGERRCCHCIYSTAGAARFCPLVAKEATQILSLTTDQLANVRSLTSLSGQYYQRSSKREPSIKLYDRIDCLDQVFKTQGLETGWKIYEKVCRYTLFLWKGMKRLESDHFPIPPDAHPRTRAGMTLVIAPWLNDDCIAEWPLRCDACQRSGKSMCIYAKKAFGCDFKVLQCCLTGQVF